MRIISGINKGKKLYAPEGHKVRPTSDKIKESIFNIIGPINKDAIILDLFAGSGNVGIEFLARGAKHCTFVDISRKNLRYVKKNLDSCNFEDRAKVIMGDYEKVMADLGRAKEKFDYIFADPPYELNLSKNIIDKVFEYNILNKRGLLIIERDKSEKTIDNTNTSMVEYREKIYGRTIISFIRHLEEG